MVRTVRAGRRRRRSPELAGRPPAGGGTAVARPPTVADGRIPRPCPSPAYVFSRKDGPNRPSGPSTKKFAGARRTAASRWWFRPQPWWPRGFTAHGPRRPTFFPANMVQSVRKGASPEKFAGPRRTTAGERWPDISSAHGGGGL